MLALLVSAKMKKNVVFDSTLMVGRQNLFFKEKDLKEIFNFFNLKVNRCSHIFEEDLPFAEELFEKLGAHTVHSIDASNYENATFIYDLNFPIKDKIAPIYDVVIDSGTLEHIFNTPQAIKSTSDLVRLNGFYVGIFPCNNFFGHGFYQFSSEFFFRLFTNQNGFELLDVIIFIDENNPVFYKVSDTSENFQRIQFTNTKPVYIYVLAKRINRNHLFSEYPQQNDYSNYKWKGNRIKTNFKKHKKFKDYIPVYFKNLTKALLNRPLRQEKFNFKKPYFTEYKLK